MTQKEFPSRVVCAYNVAKIFESGQHETAAVRNITLHASRGELLLLLGPSGSGKTTLLTLITGFIKPTSGIVELFGRNIEAYAPGELQQIRARLIGFVFQSFHLIDSLTVAENVMVVLRFAGESRHRARRRALSLLGQFHIEHLGGKFPPMLSQGEKQRVAVARAIANDADLIVADEPTASLDSRNGLEIIRLLRCYAKEQNRCVIATSHDLRMVDFADRIVELKDGEPVQGSRPGLSGAPIDGLKWMAGTESLP